MGIGCLEISDGSMVIEHGYKCELIQRLSKDFTVLSEVGSKEEGILISPAKWIKMMRNELDAGSVKVIAEARESGTVGIYRPNGSAHTQLIRRILANVDLEDILWEAPKKPQQVWFIKEFRDQCQPRQHRPERPDSVGVPARGASAATPSSISSRRTSRRGFSPRSSRKNEVHRRP